MQEASEDGDKRDDDVAPGFLRDDRERLAPEVDHIGEHVAGSGTFGRRVAASIPHTRRGFAGRGQSRP